MNKIMECIYVNYFNRWSTTYQMVYKKNIITAKGYKNE